MPRAFLFIFLLSTTAIAHGAATIMVFGDSISSGYGLPQGTGWVDLLQQRLQREKYDYRIINASLTGETTVGGKNRIGAALKQHKPAIVVLELGANDGLRGAKIDSIRSNLGAIIDACRKSGAHVLLAGMQLPPNYGSDYIEKFRALYAELARSERVPLVPFMYEGFAADRDAFQGDGIHPTVASQPRMLDNVWPQLRPLLAHNGKR